MRVASAEEMTAEPRCRSSSLRRPAAVVGSSGEGKWSRRARLGRPSDGRASRREAASRRAGPATPGGRPESPPHSPPVPPPMIVMGESSAMRGL